MTQGQTTTGQAGGSLPGSGNGMRGMGIEPIAGSHHAAKVKDRIILRSMPKVLFLYPTLLAAFAAGLAMRYEPPYERGIALIFLVVFFINMIVFSFDFPRNASLTLFFALVAVVVSAFVINEHVVKFAPSLARWMDHLRPHANAGFYWVIAAGLAIIFVVVLMIGIRFDYWEIDGNQVVHHHGWLHGLEHYSTGGLRVEVEVTDVFELMLLRSGRLIIRLPNETPVVLENVVNIRRRQKELGPILDRLNVEVVGEETVP